MVASITEIPSPGSAAYCRAARRLRHRLGRRPHELYTALCRLSHRADAQRGLQDWRPTRPHEQFARLVRAHLDGPVLRYSARTALIDRAQRSGIGRFGANLIIAAVQHRVAGDADEGAQASAAESVARRSMAKRPFLRVLQTLLLALAVQAGLLIVAWCALLR